MIQVRAVHSQADAHRQALVASAPSRPSGRPVRQGNVSAATQRSAAGIPVAGGRAVRRQVAPRLGTWLIEFGTRLGGASVCTS
jgi:hypothetical protein